MKHFWTVICSGLMLLCLPAAGLGDEPIAALQAILAKRDCDVGSADGQWGRRTGTGVEAFAAASGIAIDRPITEDLIARIEASKARCPKPSLLGKFVPADVLAAFMAAEDGRNSCKLQPQTLSLFLTSPPVDRLEGLISSMANKNSLAAFNVLDKFAGAFSELAVVATARKDDELKTKILVKLAEWADAGAYVKTRDCTNGRCPEAWQSQRGVELAPEKDSDSVLERILPMSFAYYALLADHDPGGLSKEHKAIRNWFDKFHKRLRNRSTSPQIYLGFGMGWQWLNLMNDALHNGDRAFAARLAKVQKGMDRLMLSDGSIKDRTTRGSRATWYHFSSINEFFITFEILRANGIDVYPHYEARLKKGVRIFLDALDDPASIYPWAKVDYRSGGDPRTQEFSLGNFTYADLGSSWPYIYMLRYPGDENSERLKKRIGATYAYMHMRDMAVGVGLSCLYRVPLEAAAGAG